MHEPLGTGWGPTPLTEGTLAHHAQRAAVPTYDRAALEPSIVHLGVGGFHRAHQAVYLDDLAQRGLSTQWGVVGVGLRNPAMKDALRAQDNLFTVVEGGPSGSSARIVGSMVEYLYAPDDPEAVIRVLADSRTRLVTMTITGNGYLIDAATGEFDCTHPDVVADLGHPARPRTVFGYLTEALDRRRRCGAPPFTVLSCDNLPDSGRAARTAVMTFSRLRDPRLSRWIGEHVSFPSGMVDRITPATSTEHRRFVAEKFGIVDRWPVITEPFGQWVVEDDFCNGRPPLDLVGVQFVHDVAAYKLLKNRLLNGSHCALGYLGWLLGHRRTDEAVADPLLRRYVKHLMAHEIEPLLPVVPGIDVREYERTLLERFANPVIGDQLARLCASGSVKMPSYLLPSLVEACAHGRPHTLLTVAVAAWCRYLSGFDQHGRSTEVVDARAVELRASVAEFAHDPSRLLGLVEIFGSLGRDASFGRELSEMLEQLDREDLRTVLWRCLGRSRHEAAAELRRASSCVVASDISSDNAAG